ncbi:hypothetical protein A3K01_04285 [candidate division WWE3 bacterium RIFOXYD1_FULL_43_17]|uniref:Polymerase nucleotidyl transferase domain-containing protein n=3 Tax=Katanobacteria TaxID=422282 RepID=A0A1F4XG66_UNCKA|nr:MAG: hypothetical protein UU59_C0022G0018 [candidate division WWE3 bacterium GW2011_GWE1_41_27]KKS59785.1 MAG: hypothetical protein UV26_C0015G0017 [candidate division WWE3 bacterium GW2011_GWF2_42_42]OGC80662.1 MAG: hypothetical protein A3K01_04285 [candidate division WWE3 bacterium RIFOXYD1_FULL_43_17]
MRKSNAKETAKAIKRTLAYRSIFQYPMSFFQLSTFLVSSKAADGKKLKETLNKLVKENWARKRYGKYEICGEKYTNWLWKYRHATRIFKENSELIKFLGGIPWIKMIAVTGSLAAYNPEKDADIDIMIVTGKNRVWLTRGFVATILKILKRHPEFDGQPRSFCTNLFLDETKMAWEKERRNIFVATDIVMMQPVVDKSDTYLQFMKENSWVTEYFPNFKLNYPSKVRRKSSGILLNALEKIAKKSQMVYMKKKVTTEVLKSHIIHFNKNDNSPRIMEAYKDALKRLKVSK